MPRTRLIEPEFFENEDLAKCSHSARLVFIGLWQLADRDGRLKDQVMTIHGHVFPHEPGLDVGSMLVELANRGLIVRYFVDGRYYICIPTFHDHQKIHPREKSRNYPCPKEITQGSAEPDKRFGPATPKVRPGKPDSDSDSTSDSDSDITPPASPPVKHTKADVDKGEFDKLGLVAVKLGFGENGPKCVNAMFKRWPTLRSEPQRLAWYLSRVSHRRYVELEPITEPWAYLTEIITKYFAVPAVCQGGDDNCYKEHLTVSEYCDPILGIPKQPDPLRGGGFERL